MGVVTDSALTFVPFRERIQGSTARTSAAGFNYGAFMAEVIQVVHS